MDYVENEIIFLTPHFLTQKYYDYMLGFFLEFLVYVLEIHIICILVIVLTSNLLSHNFS